MIYIVYVFIFVMFLSGVWFLLAENFVFAVSLLGTGVAGVVFLVLAKHKLKDFSLTMTNTSLIEFLIIFLVLNISLAFVLFFKQRTE